MTSKNPAFRGYLIRENRGQTWIERDGFLIGWAKNEDDAKRIIRDLTDPVAANPQRRKGGRNVRFLVNNPGKTRANKGGDMKRKTPPRYKSGPKKGQFMSKAARRRKARKNPIAARASSRNAPRRRAAAAPKARPRYRRNPPRRGNLVDTFINGAMGAGGVLVGKAAVRSLPQLLSLPQAGNVGLAVQAATAVAAGWVADRFVGSDVAQYILAGGLSAPMESLIIRVNVPWLSTALASSGAVAGYVQPRGFVAAPRMGLNGVRGYVSAPAVTAGGRAAGYAYYN